MVKHLNSFWVAGLWAGFLPVFIEISFRLFNLRLDPILAVVFGVAVWVGILVVTRRYIIRADNRRVAALSAHISRSGTQFTSLDEFLGIGEAEQPEIMTRASLPRSQLTLLFDPGLRRFRYFALRDCMENIRESVLLWYTPVESLVWSLPAIGFLGTAVKLRSAVTIALGQGLSTSEQTFRDIGPVLLNALLIISCALGLTVVTYVAVALTLRTDLETMGPVRELLNELGELSKTAQARKQRQTGSGSIASY